ncbi:hypothetical protein D3C81_1759300 [compost metagenome]
MQVFEVHPAGLAHQCQRRFVEAPEFQVAEYGLVLMFQVITHMAGDESAEAAIGARYGRAASSPLPGQCLEVFEDQLQQQLAFALVIEVQRRGIDPRFGRQLPKAHRAVAITRDQFDGSLADIGFSHVHG